jgi:hypothetical protein
VRIIPVFLAALLLTACSERNPAGPTDMRIVGTWVQGEAVAGTSFVLRLNAQNTNVTGTGNYTAEGGRSGALTATGKSSEGAVNLEIRYDGAEAQFTGAQVSDSELSGSLHLGPAQSLTPSHIVKFTRRD